MKKLAIIAISACSVLLLSCSDKRPAHYDTVEDAARRDAAKVVDAKENSMDREHAVLAIRVREHALRANGYETEADIYLSTAHHILVDSLKIISNNNFEE